MNSKKKTYLIKLWLTLLLSGILMLSISVPAFSAQKGQKKPPSLPKEHVQKLKRIAGIISGELVKKGIQTVIVEDFIDLEGRHSSDGKLMAQELANQLTTIGKNSFSVIKSNASAIVKGTLIPFKGKKKWKLEIKVVYSDTGNIITSYTGILKTKK